MKIGEQFYKNLASARNCPGLYIVSKTQNHKYPLIKIQVSRQSSGRTDIRVSFIGTSHHYSLHEARISKEDSKNYVLDLHKQPIQMPKSYTGSPPIVFTSFDESKPRGVWDEEKVAVADKLKIPNPAKHAKYYENRVLPLGAVPAPFLGGRGIGLVKEKTTYPEEKCIYVEKDVRNLFVEVYFTITGFSEHMDGVVNTPIGKLGFLFK